MEQARHQDASSGPCLGARPRPSTQGGRGPRTRSTARFAQSSSSRASGRFPRSRQVPQPHRNGGRVLHARDPFNRRHRLARRWAPQPRHLPRRPTDACTELRLWQADRRKPGRSCPATTNRLSTTEPPAMGERPELRQMVRRDLPDHNVERQRRPPTAAAAGDTEAEAIVVDAADTRAPDSGEARPSRDRRVVTAGDDRRKRLSCPHAQGQDSNDSPGSDRCHAAS